MELKDNGSQCMIPSAVSFNVPSQPLIWAPLEGPLTLSLANLDLLGGLPMLYCF